MTVLNRNKLEKIYSVLVRRDRVTRKFNEIYDKLIGNHCKELKAVEKELAEFGLYPPFDTLKILNAARHEGGDSCKEK